MPLPGIGEGFFNNIRLTILGTFQALPAVFIILSGFLAASTANIGMILIFLTQIIVIPVLQILSSYIRSMGWVQRIFSLDPNLTYGTSSKFCSFSPVDVKSDMVPPVTSYWMANFLFFTTYLFFNAVAMLEAKSETKNASPTKVENRKAHAITSMILILVVTTLLAVNYIQYMECETLGSFLFASAVYVPLGIGVFKLAEYCGIRTADTFGIASKLYLPGPGETEFPYACVNITKK